MAKMIRQRPTHFPRTVEDHRLRDKDCMDGEISILSQVNVPRDGRAPSVPEVLWMLPE